MNSRTLPDLDLSSEKLPLSLKLVYAVGNLGFTLLISGVGFFLLIFYTDVAHIPPALASTALLVGKIWDIINDPLFGWVSDRTESPLGRRRVYLIYGALPLALVSFALWAVPRGLSSTTAFLWIVVSYALFDTFFTITNVPFNALTAELTHDYDERTSLMAVASIGAVVGYLLGAVLPTLITGRFEDLTTGYLVMGAVFGGIVGLSIALVAWKVREPARSSAVQAGLPVMASIRATFSNRPFILLLTAFAVVRLSFTLMQSSVPYFIRYQLNSPGSMTLIMTLLMGSVGVFVYFWKWISDKTSKSRAYAVGLVIMGAGAVITFFIQEGQVAVMNAVVVLIGFGLSAHWVAPYAMLPDVIEHDEAATGERREGMYYGVYGLVDKIMRTLGVFIVGMGLEFFGYIPNVAQTSRSLLGIRIIFGPLPALLLLLVFPLLLRYPVTRQSHTALRKKLAQRKAEQS
ncbi:MAG: MFS transporter [Anaerolineales bacterium]|nr:MFS transporter [Anaerolineales bacterium]